MFYPVERCNAQSISKFRAFLIKLFGVKRIVENDGFILTIYYYKGIGYLLEEGIKVETVSPLN